MKGKKVGGRQKGTPNKANAPLKNILRQHSEKYFEPRPQENPVSKEIEILSDFDVDMLSLEPSAKVAAEIKLLEFHTPKMKSVDIDMDANINSSTLEDTLARLCGEVIE